MRSLLALFILATAAGFALGQGSAAAGLSDLELAIGQNFETAVSRDADARKYMLTFVDPAFFARTSKLRKLWGRASVVDGETLIIGGERVRLYGVKAPDISQTCSERTLNLQFDAGGFALGRLKTWARGDKAVVCYVEQVQPAQGTCFTWGLVGPMNLARLLVREGAVWASPPNTSPYVRDEGWAEGVASRDKDPTTKNLWHTDCQPPWKQPSSR